MEIDDDVLDELIDGLEEDMSMLDQYDEDVPGDHAIMREHMQQLYAALNELQTFRAAYPDTFFEPIFFTEFGAQGLQ